MKKIQLLLAGTIIATTIFGQQGAVSSPDNLVTDSKDNVYFLHQNGLGKITAAGEYINLVNKKETKTRLLTSLQDSASLLIHRIIYI